MCESLLIILTECFSKWSLTEAFLRVKRIVRTVQQYLVIKRRNLQCPTTSCILIPLKTKVLSIVKLQQIIHFKIKFLWSAILNFLYFLIYIVFIIKLTFVDFMALVNICSWSCKNESDLNLSLPFFQNIYYLMCYLWTK